MTILHARSNPQLTEYPRSVFAEANGHPHDVDIAAGYFYHSGFTQVSDLLATQSGKVPLCKCLYPGLRPDLPPTVATCYDADDDIRPIIQTTGRVEKLLTIETIPKLGLMNQVWRDI